MNLNLYRKAYDHNGTDVDSALHLVGANAAFEMESQSKFMKDQGLLPHHRFLDLACGCLRGTVKLVDYLKQGHFHGADVSPGLLRAASQYCLRLGVKNTPVLHAMDDFDLFNLIGTKFDYVLSVSLLTHLLPESIPELFRGVEGILKPDGVWYFTIYPGDRVFHEGTIGLSFYQKSWLIEEGKKAGLRIKDIPGDFPNPMRNFTKRVNVEGMAQWVMKATL